MSTPDNWSDNLAYCTIATRPACTGDHRRSAWWWCACGCACRRHTAPSTSTTRSTNPVDSPSDSSRSCIRSRQAEVASETRQCRRSGARRRQVAADPRSAGRVRFCDRWRPMPPSGWPPGVFVGRPCPSCLHSSRRTRIRPLRWSNTTTGGTKMLCRCTMPPPRVHTGQREAEEKTFFGQKIKVTSTHVQAKLEKKRR
jgi:hypothetical protein